MDSADIGVVRCSQLIEADPFDDGNKARIGTNLIPPRIDFEETQSHVAILIRFFQPGCYRVSDRDLVNIARLQFRKEIAHGGGLAEGAFCAASRRFFLFDSMAS